MTNRVEPAEIEAAVLRARWDVLRAEAEQLRHEMTDAVAACDEQRVRQLNVRVQAHRSRLHDFEVAASAFRERFQRELRL